MKGLKPGRPGKAIGLIPEEELLLPWPGAGMFGTGKLFSFVISLFSLGSMGCMGVLEV